MAVSSTVEGSVVFVVDMNISDAEKELAKLKKRIFKLEDDIGDKTALKNNLKSKLDDLSKEYLDFVKKNKHTMDESGKIAFSSDEAHENAKKMFQKIEKIRADIEKCDEAIDKWNVSLEYTKQRYGEIAKKAQELRAEEQKSSGSQADGGGTVDRRAEVMERQQRIFDHLKDELHATQKLTSAVADDMQEKLSSAFEPIYQRISPPLDRIKGKLSEAFQPLYEKLQLGEVKKSLEIALNGIREKLQLDEVKNSLGIALDGIQDRISGFVSKIVPDLKYAAGSMQIGMSGLLEGASQIPGKLGAALSAISPHISVATTAAKALIIVLKKLWDAMKKFAQEATQALMTGAKAVASFAVSGAKAFVAMLKSIGKFGKTAIKAIASLTKKVLDFGKRINVFSRLTDSLSGSFKRLGSTIKSALVFSVIYKGLSMVREQMGAYLSVNTQFMTAVRRMQGVLLTAFQPIYEVVVPALTTLINVLARAAATVTQFFASLFGTTAKQAQANAKDLYDQANATTAAGDAAEEAAKQLAGFDEINKLEGNKKAGAGGSTSVDTGPLFDYDYDETPFDTWGEAFSAFLDKMLGGIPKLRDVFKKFADWLNDFSRKLYDMFTFPGVLDKVKRLGRELAEALNDLVNWIDWYQLGQALGAGLNLALNFLTSFLYAFDWMNLGRKLAEFVNGLVSEVDWYEFGRLLWAGFKIGLETFAGFITGLDMPQLAEAASNIILGFFDEMKNTIDLIQWDLIGTQIATFLNNIKWYDIITHALSAISAAINALFLMVRNFIDELHWGDIATQIYTAINDSLGQIRWREIASTIGDAFIRVFNFLREIIAGIEWGRIGQDIADFILEFDFVGVLGALADLIAEGINAAVKMARSFLDRIMPEVEGIAKGIADRLRNAVKSVEWGDLASVISDSIKTALTFVAGLLDPELFAEIGRSIGEFFLNIDWPGILEGLGNVLANAINSAVALVRNFLDVVEPNLHQIALDIATKINEFVDKINWEDLGETLNRGIQAALDFLVTLMDNINWDDIKDAVQTALSEIEWADVAEKVAKLLVDWFGIKAQLAFLKLETLVDIGVSIIDGLKKGILTALLSIPIWIKQNIVDPIVNAVKDFLGIHSPSTVFAEIGKNLIAGLLQGITDTWSTIVEFFQGVIDDLKQFFSDAWESIKSTAENVWNSLKDFFSTTWDGIKEKTTAVWNDIKTALETAWNGLKEKASSLFTSIKEKITEVWSGVKEKTSSTWESIKSTLSSTWESLKSTAESAFNNIKEKVVNAWNTLRTETQSKWEEIKGTLSSKWNEIKTNAGNKFQEVKQTVIDKFNELKNHDWFSIGKTIVDGIVNGLQSIWNTLTGWVRDVKNAISDALSGASSSRGGGFGTSGRAGSFGGGYRMSVQSMPDMGNFEIPALAKGAVIPPNREFLAVLGDQRSGTNVEAPLKTIEQAVENVMSRIGSSGGDVTVVVNLDGREVARNTVHHINDMTRQSGKPVLLL